jgi:hypothetical protein
MWNSGEGQQKEAPSFFSLYFATLFAMPLNESTSKPRRERWPASFDIEGIPRDTATRKAHLEQKRIQEESMKVTNTFTVDQPAGPVITDINNPPHVNYNPYDAANQYPKMLYHHGTGRVLKVGQAIPPGVLNDPAAREKIRLQNEREEKAATKRGFQLKPSPDHDYSKVNRAGVAAPADHGEKREEEMSAEELAALDEQGQAG